MAPLHWTKLHHQQPLPTTNNNTYITHNLYQNQNIISPPPTTRRRRITLLSLPNCRSPPLSASSLPSFFRGRNIPTETQINTAAMSVDGKHSNQRYAVVTGANKGIGLETVRQLARAGVTVVLTARDESRGTAAVQSLCGDGGGDSGLSNILFHQLDVQDPNSIESLAHFIRTNFGRLDILVNNAGVSGVLVDEDGLRALNIDPSSWLSGKATGMVQGVIKTTYEKATECVDTNYYGVKSVTKALLPLLKLSTSGGRIVNVSSLRGELRRIPNEQTRKELGDIDALTEEKIDKLVEKFMRDLKQDALEANGWSKMLPAYSVSKVMLNAYTRVLARDNPKMLINCVHPGFVNTDINWHTGTMTVAEGAEGPVMLALLPNGGFTGCYFDRTKVAEF